MAKKTAPSSRVRPSVERAPRRRLDVREWLGGIRLSGFMVIMMGLVVLAAFVLVPTIGTYIGQRQQIAALERSVQVTREEVDELERQRDRWKDSAYITTQARERLYYVKPGEIVYLVDNDLPPELMPQEQAVVSADVEQTRTDWMAQFVRSVTESGLSQTVAPPTIGVPDPEPTETPAP